MTLKNKAVKIPNDSKSLKEVSKELINHLKTMNVIEEIIFDVHVAFEEALRNAMVHGNKSQKDKMVMVQSDISDGKVIISVEDEGNGFDPGKLPDCTIGENLLKESGRGVYLMRHLMDKVSYELGGRKVIMEKKLIMTKDGGHHAVKSR